MKTKKRPSFHQWLTRHPFPIQHLFNSTIEYKSEVIIAMVVCFAWRERPLVNFEHQCTSSCSWQSASNRLDIVAQHHMDLSICMWVIEKEEGRGLKPLVSIKDMIEWSHMSALCGRATLLKRIIHTHTHKKKKDCVYIHKNNKKTRNAIRYNWSTSLSSSATLITLAGPKRVTTSFRSQSLSCWGGSI